MIATVTLVAWKPPILLEKVVQLPGLVDVDLEHLLGSALPEEAQAAVICHQCLATGKILLWSESQDAAHLKLAIGEQIASRVWANVDGHPRASRERDDFLPLQQRLEQGISMWIWMRLQLFSKGLQLLRSWARIHLLHNDGRRCCTLRPSLPLPFSIPSTVSFALPVSRPLPISPPPSCMRASVVISCPPCINIAALHAIESILIDQRGPLWALWVEIDHKDALSQSFRQVRHSFRRPNRTGLLAAVSRQHALTGSAMVLVSHGLGCC